MLSIGTLGPSRIRPRNGGETFLPTVTTKVKRLSPLQFSLLGQFKMKGMREINHSDDHLCKDQKWGGQLGQGQGAESGNTTYAMRVTVIAGQ
jgi:hypothetical protein